MFGKTKISLLKPLIEENGLSGCECRDIDKFILILKTIESIDSDIPGIVISEATADDNLNEGESYIDLISNDVTHYCAKTIKGEKFINNDKLVLWAETFLVKANGNPDYTNINIMKKHGFDVSPGEADSFGWLTGVISTSKGKIVFG